MIIVILVLISLVVGSRFLSVPLERDSAEYVYSSYVLSKGGVFYKDTFDTRIPGQYFILSPLAPLLMKNFVYVNFLVMVLSAFNTVIIFFLGRMLFGNKAAFIVSLLFLFLSKSPYVEGFTLSAELFIQTFSFLGFLVYFKYFFIRASSQEETFFSPALGFRKRFVVCLFAGLFFGLSFVIKPIGVVDFVVFLVIFLVQNTREHNLSLKERFILLVPSILGFLVPLALISMYFLVKNAWSEFVYYAFIFNFEYIKLLGHKYAYWQKFILFNRNFFVDSFPFFILCFLFFFTDFVLFFRKKKFYPRLFIFLWVLLAFTGVCVSGRFFPHYYMMLIGPFSLLCGYSLYRINEADYRPLVKRLFLSVFGILMCFSFAAHYPFYFKYSPYEIINHTFPLQPFSESYEVGLYLKDNTRPDDYLFVWAEEPEIFYYSRRKSVCKYISDIPFVYYRGITREDPSSVLLNGLTRYPPEFLVFDTRHIRALKHYPAIRGFFKENYVFDREVKIIRYEEHLYSLLIFRRIHSE